DPVQEVGHDARRGDGRQVGEDEDPAEPLSEHDEQPDVDRRRHERQDGEPPEPARQPDLQARSAAGSSPGSHGSAPSSPHGSAPSSPHGSAPSSSHAPGSSRATASPSSSSPGACGGVPNR